MARTKSKPGTFIVYPSLTGGPALHLPVEVAGAMSKSRVFYSTKKHGIVAYTVSKYEGRGDGMSLLVLHRPAGYDPEKAQLVRITE